VQYPQLMPPDVLKVREPTAAIEESKSEDVRSCIPDGAGVTGQRRGVTNR
jgi:hypothetical protein